MNKNKKKQNKETIKGVIFVVANGSGFLDLENEDSIRIPFQYMNTALHGDEVEVVLFPQILGEKRQGEVINVVKRKKIDFVGTIDRKRNDNFAFLIPDDSKMYTDIFIPNINFKIENNLKALVRIKEWKDSKKNPIGEVIKIIGEKGDINTEMQSIVIERGLNFEFSQEIEKEAEKLKKESFKLLKKETKKRKDFRNVSTFTIDPEDAKDFDDAVSFKKISSNFFEVGVHIADVGFWVKERGLIDKEARKRGFSLYLVDRTIPMLPEFLSNDVCSLNPNEDKLAFSVIFQIDSKGNVKKTKFLKTVINSNKRFDYKQAQIKIDKRKNEELFWLMEISKKLRKKRIENGSLDLDQEEVAIDIDKKGKPRKIYIKERLPTHYLIEEFMILANRKVADFMSKRKELCLYRIHEKPDRDSIENLYNFLSKVGYNFKKKHKKDSSQGLNELLKEIKGKDEEFLVKSVLIRSLPKAVYSIFNKGHFALALSNYTHFTSPIRRYADLLVHRSLNKVLSGSKANKKEKDFYKKTSQDLMQKELDSLSAERESISYKQVEYMLDRVGNNYKGIITGVTEWGIYISELETKAEGMVRLRDMKDDYYVLDKENFTIMGTRNKKKYSLGDKVKFKVIGGSIDEKILNYSFN